MNIDVFTCLSANSVPYANVLLENLRHKSSGYNSIRFYAILTEPNKTEDIDKLDPAFNICYIPEMPDNTKGSERHAAGLNSIVKYIPHDSEMIVVADCDIIMLQDKWDQWFSIMHKTYTVVGTEKHDHTLRMFFMSIFPAWDYEYMGFDYSGSGSEWHTPTDKECKDIYKIPSGSRIVRDTGWKLSSQIVKAGKKFHKLPVTNDGHEYGVLYHIGGSHKKYFRSGNIWFIYRDLQERHKILPDAIYKKLILVPEDTL